MQLLENSPEDRISNGLLPLAADRPGLGALPWHGSGSRHSCLPNADRSTAVRDSYFAVSSWPVLYVHIRGRKARGAAHGCRIRHAIAGLAKQVVGACGHDRPCDFLGQCQRLAPAASLHKLVLCGVPAPLPSHPKVQDDGPPARQRTPVQATRRSRVLEIRYGGKRSDRAALVRSLAVLANRMLTFGMAGPVRASAAMQAVKKRGQPIAIA